jgi:hypothetical protein
MFYSPVERTGKAMLPRTLITARLFVLSIFTNQRPGLSRVALLWPEPLAGMSIREGDLSAS